MTTRTTHSAFPDYGWTTPSGNDESHYVQNARLIGRAGWLGWTICSVKSGGNVPLLSAPPTRACKVCASKTGLER